MEITKPASGSNLGTGAFFTVTLEAKFFDPDPWVQNTTPPRVVWSSNKDGALGQSSVVKGIATLTVTLSGKSTRTIKAQAFDQLGATADDSVTVVTDNAQPTVTIKAPTGGATLYTGVPYVFESESFDPEAFHALPCGSLTWTSSKTGDPFPRTGCNPTVTFTTTGTRTLTLKGLDAEGAQGTDTVVVSVVNPPASSPPVVTILNPLNNTLLQPNAEITLRATANDPDGSATISYEWILVRFNGTTKILGTTSSANGGQKTLKWTPRNDVPFNCGGTAVKIRVRATDQGGQTGTKTVDVTVAYPPC